MKNKEKTKEGKNGKRPGRRISLAIEQAFFLEAIWIASAMLERKMKKALGKAEDIVYGKGFSLEKTLNRVRYVHQSGKYPAFSSHFGPELITETRKWKNQRNGIFRDMQKVHLLPARLERAALEGERLVREWDRAGKKFRPGDPGPSAPGKPS